MIKHVIEVFYNKEADVWEVFDYTLDKYGGCEDFTVKTFSDKEEASAFADMKKAGKYYHKTELLIMH